MALVSEYGGIRPSMFTYQTYSATIETMSALLLLYSIIEEEYSTHGTTYHFFQKSFWGKKQRGFLQLEYLSGSYIDTIKKNDEDGKSFPSYTDILIGIYYGSAYSTVNWNEQSRVLNMVAPEKQVLSYGILLENIKVQINAIRTLQAEEFNSAGDIMLLNTSRMSYLRKNIELLEAVKKRFEIFDKYLSTSAFQPTEDD